MKIQSDFIQAFTAIANDVHQIAKEKGWWDVQTAEEWYKAIGKGEVYLALQGDDDREAALKAAYEDGQQNPMPNKGEKIALMHSENSEALEGIRKPGPDKHCPQFSNEVIELADDIIRKMDYAEYYGLPLAEAIIAKAEFNKTRAHKHGGKKF